MELGSLTMKHVNSCFSSSWLLRQALHPELLICIQPQPKQENLSYEEVTELSGFLSGIHLCKIRDDFLRRNMKLLSSEVTESPYKLSAVEDRGGREVDTASPPPSVLHLYLWQACPSLMPSPLGRLPTALIPQYSCWCTKETQVVWLEGT